MKIITTLIILLLFANCRPPDSSKKTDRQITDTTTSNDTVNSFQPDSAVIEHKEKMDTIYAQKIDPAAHRKTDTVLLMKVSGKILKYIKTRNYKELTLFIYPKDHLRFSPYAYVNTKKDRVFSADQLLKLANQNQRINWNSSWDEEKPELLTIDGYFKKFVYDVDFLNAELKSINQYHSQGTDLNNINEAYPGCDVVEFFFSGFEKKYEGLDFRALRLVFKIKNNKPWLTGIVHDQWTP